MSRFIKEFNEENKLISRGINISIAPNGIHDSTSGEILIFKSNTLAGDYLKGPACENNNLNIYEQLL